MLEATPSKVLPRLVEPRKLVQNQGVFRGLLPGDALTRLADAVVAVTRLTAELHFVVDDGGDKVMRGYIEGEVTVACQRCLGPMDLPLRAQFDLAVVWDEDHAKCLPKHLDPWIVAEQEADLYLILEEELLLALPSVAYHEEVCIDASLMSAGEAATETPQRAGNPFEVLKKLKKE